MYAVEGVIWPVIWMVANVIMGCATFGIVVDIRGAGGVDDVCCDSEIVASGERKREDGVKEAPCPSAFPSATASLLSGDSSNEGGVGTCAIEIFRACGWCCGITETGTGTGATG